MTQRKLPNVRLFVPDDLGAQAHVGLNAAQAHYLEHVMRMGEGGTVKLFNGRDGEWQGVIDEIGRSICDVLVLDQLRPQEAGPDLWLAFAPIKRVRIDLIAEKATELGASALWPVFTANTQVSRVNTERLHAHAVEAAEQCHCLAVPEIREPAKLMDMLSRWPKGRRLLLCDESGASPPVLEALGAIHEAGNGAGPGPWAVLIGPEGGFTRLELDALRNLPFVTAAGLGPRLLRADTAAVSALSCWQAVLGDWRAPDSGS